MHKSRFEYKGIACFWFRGLYLLLHKYLLPWRTTKILWKHEFWPQMFFSFFCYLEESMVSLHYSAELLEYIYNPSITRHLKLLPISVQLTWHKVP